MLISLAIAEKNEKISTTVISNYFNELEMICDQLPFVIEKSTQWVEKNLDKFAEAKRLMFIGYGAAYGVSREGETKITEAVRISSWGKELEEYMHGPYLGLRNDGFVVFLEPNGRLEKRANLLQEFLKRHVENIYKISANNSGVGKKDLNLKIQTNELLASLFLTIPIHILSYRLSQRKEIDLQHSAYPDFDEITASKI